MHLVRGRIASVGRLVRNRVQERGSAAFAQNAGDALEIGPDTEQPHDERRMSDQVTGSDDAAHSGSVFPENGFSKHFSGQYTYMDLRDSYRSCGARAFQK